VSVGRQSKLLCSGPGFERLFIIEFARLKSTRGGSREFRRPNLSIS